MRENIKVFMRSAEYGVEEFGPYDSWLEAFLASERLQDRARQEQEKDGIERTVGIATGLFNTISDKD